MGVHASQEICALQRTQKENSKSEIFATLRALRLSGESRFSEFWLRLRRPGFLDLTSPHNFFSLKRIPKLKKRRMR